MIARPSAPLSRVPMRLALASAAVNAVALATGLAIAMGLVLAPAPAFASDLPSLAGIQGDKSSIQYSGWYEPSSQQAIQMQNLRVALQTWSNESERVVLDGRASWLDPINAPDFQEYALGATYTHKIDQGRSLSFNGNFGSASDHPFADTSVDTVSATSIYAFPQSEQSRWALLLNYSNNRPILNNIPLPGFAYTYTPSRDLLLTAGIPFASIVWKFAPDWSLSAFAVVPWIFRASVSRAIAGPVQAFASIDFSQQTYFRLGRSDLKERLFYDEKRATLGLRSPLSEMLTAELEGGYAFGRQFFDAQNYGSDHFNVNRLDASPVLRLALSASF